MTHQDFWKRGTRLPVAALFAASVLALLLSSSAVQAQSLRGSRVSLDRQAQQARLHEFTYVRRAVQLKRLVGAGLLVPVQGNRNYVLHGVSFEVARPEVKVFIERLGAQYRAACGEALVVTSLTRPTSGQPGNASPRSVHPTGMAIDLRRSSRARCRAWLESTLLTLETRRVLEATLERHPPHYHVALFPAEYLAYVERSNPSRTAARKQAPAAPKTPSLSARPPAPVGTGLTGRHTVARQETLWSISRQYDMTVPELRAANGLMSTDIRVGQVLEVASNRR